MAQNVLQEQKQYLRVNCGSRIRLGNKFGSKSPHSTFEGNKTIDGTRSR